MQQQAPIPQNIINTKMKKENPHTETCGVPVTESKHMSAQEKPRK